MQYALDNIVALINRKEPLPVTFTRALAGVCDVALHRGIYPIEVQQLFADMRLELPSSYFVEPEGIIKSEHWYKVVRILERSGISVVPISVPANLSIYQTVYLLKRPDITSDEDIATLQRLVTQRKARHTNGELEIIARAKEKLSNYNIMLRVFEYLGAAQVRSLDANQRSVLQTILDQHPLPHDGMRYVRTLYSYACDIGSYHYDYSDPKLVLPKLPDAEHSTALDIVARTIAPSRQAIKIPDDFPYLQELASDYRDACPRIFHSVVEVEEAPRRPLSLRLLSEINANQRQRRLDQRLERVLEPLRAAHDNLAQLQQGPMIKAIEAKTGTTFSWENPHQVGLAHKLQAAKQQFDEEQRREDAAQAQKEAEAAATLAAALAAQQKSRNKKRKRSEAEDAAQPVVSEAAKVIAEAVRAAAAAKKNATAEPNAGAEAEAATPHAPDESPVAGADDLGFNYEQYIATLEEGALDGAAPEGAARATGTLKGAAPDGTMPAAAELDGAAPDGAVLDGATPDAAELDGATPDAAELDGAAPDGTCAAPARYYEDLQGALPEEVDSEQVAALMMVKGVRTGFAPSLLAQVERVLGSSDPDVGPQLARLAAELKDNERARLMLPDFSKTKLSCYFNGYELALPGLDPKMQVTVPRASSGEVQPGDLAAQINTLVHEPLSVEGCREQLQQAKNSLYEAYVVAIGERYEQELQAQQNLDLHDKKREVRRKLSVAKQKPTVVVGTAARRNLDPSLVDPTEFKYEWVGTAMGLNFEHTINAVHDNEVALARWVNLGEFEVQQYATTLGALEHFHVVPWVWDELSFLHHSYLVWSNQGAITSDNLAAAYPDLNQDYGVNLKLFVQSPLKQSERLQQVLCYELVLRPLFAPAPSGSSEERSAQQLLALMHYNLTAQQSLDLIPAAFYHGLVYFDRYLAHPEEHVNLEHFYLAVARLNPYAFNLFLTRVVSHFGPKLSAIPEQFFELIMLNLVLFTSQDQGASAQTTWRLLKDDSSRQAVLNNILALRIMARALYCLVHSDPTFASLELTQVSYDSIARQLAQQEDLVAKLRAQRQRAGTALQAGHAYAHLAATNPKYVQSLVDLTLSVAAAELKLAGFKVEHSAQPKDNAALVVLVEHMVQQYLNSGDLPLPPQDEAAASESGAELATSAAALEHAVPEQFGSESAAVSTDYAQRFGLERRAQLEDLDDELSLFDDLPAPKTLGAAQVLARAGSAGASVGGTPVGGASVGGAAGAGAAASAWGGKSSDFVALGGAHAPHVVRSPRSANHLAYQAWHAQGSSAPEHLMPRGGGAASGAGAAAGVGAAAGIGAASGSRGTARAEAALGAQAPLSAAAFDEFFDDDAALAAQAQAERRAAQSAHKGMGALEAGSTEATDLMGSSFLVQAMSEGLKALQESNPEAVPHDLLGLSAAPEVEIEPEVKERSFEDDAEAQGIIAVALKSALSVLPLPKLAPDEVQQAEERAILAQLFAEHPDWIQGLSATNRVGLNPNFIHRTLAWSNPEFNALTAQAAPLFTHYVAPVVRRVLCQNERRFYTLSQVVDLRELYNLRMRGADVFNRLIPGLYQESLVQSTASIYGLSCNRLLLNLVLYGFGRLGSLHLLKEEFAPSVPTLETLQVKHRSGALSLGEDGQVPTPRARVEEWRHKITHRLKTQLQMQFTDAQVEAQLSQRPALSLLDCLAAFSAEQGEALAPATQFWTKHDLPRAQRLEQQLLALTSSAQLGFNSGLLEQELLELGRISEESLGLCLVPSPSLMSARFNFKLLRPSYQHLRFIVIPPELLVSEQGREFYLRLKATLHYAYLGLELVAAVLPLGAKEGLVLQLARYIMTMYASQGHYQVERLVLEYLHGAVNIILEDGPLSYDELMQRSLHLYSGNDVNSLNLHADNIKELQRFFALGVTFEFKQHHGDKAAQLRYVNLLARLYLTPAPTSDCQHKASKVANMVSSYFFDPDKNENLLRTGIFWNLRSYHEPEQLVLDAEKIRRKLLESAEVQDVITKLREEESGVDESGPSLSEVMAQKHAAQHAAQQAAQQSAPQVAQQLAPQAAPQAVDHAVSPALSQEELHARAAEPQPESGAKAAATGASESTPGAAAAQSLIGSLNPKLQKVIEALAVQGTDAMVYSEFNGICVSHGLLSGNYAIEVLNEFSFEHFDEPLLELEGSGNSAIVYLTVDLLSKLHDEYRQLIS